MSVSVDWVIVIRGMLEKYYSVISLFYISYSDEILSTQGITVTTVQSESESLSYSNTDIFLYSFTKLLSYLLE